MPKIWHISPSPDGLGMQAPKLLFGFELETQAVSEERLAEIVKNNVNKNKILNLPKVFMSNNLGINTHQKYPPL